MLITTTLSLFFLFWSGLFLVDFYLRSLRVQSYIAFVEHHGLTVSPFQVRFYINRIEHAQPGAAHRQGLARLWTCSQRRVRLLSCWFSVGALVGLVCFALTPFYLSWLLVIELSNALTFLRHLFSVADASQGGGGGGIGNLEEETFRAAISSINAAGQSFFYVPLQEHVQTGITPVIPGVNIPWAHLPLFMLVLVIAGAFHEIGHAVAALSANIRLNGFGVFLFGVYPGAFTEIESEELGRSSTAMKLRVFSAGIWHNIVLALVGLAVIWVAPHCLVPFYSHGAGVLIADVSERSGLAGATGLQAGMVVTRINQCHVRNASDWSRCLQRMHEQQKRRSAGYLVHYSKVLPLTASPDNVDDAASGEVQCCSEFRENVTTSSHICFRYLQQQQQQRVLQQRLFGAWRAAAAAAERTTPAANFAESLGVAANVRAKRANLKPKVAPQAQAGEEEPSGEDAPQPSTRRTAAAVVHTAAAGGGQAPSVWHACLPARQVTDHAACELDDASALGGAKELPLGYVCAVPALYNGTALLRFELKDRPPVLFIGFLSEPLFMIDMMDLTPRWWLVPYWIPQVVELFGKYIVTFSLAMGLLNAVPCYGLDGQFMSRTVVDYFFARRSPLQRQRIGSLIILYGSVVFSLNVAIGFTKFMFSYWK